MSFVANVKAHLDGKVLVPDEPLNLPANCAVELEFRPVSAKPLLALAAQLAPLPDNADWPEDGPSQHDHYLYGTRKLRDASWRNALDILSRNDNLGR
jgi:hypothetical protein